MNTAGPNHRNRWRRRLGAAVAIAVITFAFREPLVAWFTLEPMGESASVSVASRAGALSIETSISPDPPRQNGNTLWIDLEDSSGQAVENAEVEVGYSMPAMGSMPEMRGEARVSDEDRGRYRADFDLPMGGSWTLQVSVRSPRGSGTVRHTITVGSKGLTPASSDGMSAMATTPQDPAFGPSPQARGSEAMPGRGVG